MSNRIIPHMCGEAPLAYQSLSLEGEILEVNEAWEGLSGYAAEEMLGHNYAELVPQDHHADFAKNLERLERDGELVGQDCLMRRKDGAVRDILIFAKVDPSAMRTDCMLVDITDFRRTEQDLVESEERFRSLFALAPTPIVIHDGTTVLMANQASATFLGYDSPSDVIGSSVADLVAPEDRPAVAERVRRMLTEQWFAPLAEERFVRRDGTYVYGDAIAAPVVLAGQPAIYVIALDLTERRRAAEALEESEARFRELFEFSADPIVVHDGSKGLFANRATLAALGLPEGTDVAGMEILAFIHPDSYAVVGERLAVLMGGAQTEAPVELHLLRTDGTDWYAEAKSSPIHLAGRRVLQTTFRDLTERKRTEAELERYRKQLEELLMERTESLERVRQELDAVSAVVSRTVEMRDPYTAGHQRRVASLAAAIGRQLRMDEAAVEHLEVAARLHDVGKVGVPAELLSKPAQLTPLEYELVKTHVDAGYEIILSADFAGPVADIVRQHHERLDGSGYPQGLTEEQLRPEAKVLMVADVVEAISSHRPYRPSIGVHAALDEIRSNAGRLYDPAAVEACVAVFESGFDFEEPSF